MSHYRAPPEVLPSRRSILSPGARDGVLLSCESTDHEVDHAVSDGREEAARDRAALAPCPVFEVDPGAVLPPMPAVFRYRPPPPTPLPGPGRSVFE